MRTSSRSKMNNHPVLQHVKLDAREALKRHLLTIIELDMIIESLTTKEAAVERIKDLIRNA